MRSARGYIVRLRSKGGFYELYPPRGLSAEESLDWAAEQKAKFGDIAVVMGHGGTFLMSLTDSDRTELMVRVSRVGRRR